MTGGTGLTLYHIGSHYAAFKPTAENEIIVAAIHASIAQEHD